MYYNVAGLLHEPVGATRRHEVAEAVGAIDSTLEIVAPVEGYVKLTRINAGILAEAELKVAVRLSCSRCLNDNVAPLAVRLSEEYRPRIDIDTGLPLPESEDDALFTIDENHILDLSEAFRQYTLLALPLAPLCSASCAGLCPECGHDLNEGPCRCEPPPVDERLQALADLLTDTGPNTEPVGEPDRRKKRKRKR